jgi:putative DNA primase/helicase
LSAADLDLQRAAAALPTVRLVRGDTVTLEPVRWAWLWFLPLAMLTILGGLAGCGKTTIALAIAAIITRGGRWPDGTRCSEPGDVLIWSGEDAPAVVAARLAACGADMTRVHFIDGVSGGGGDDGAFDPSSDMQLLEATAERLPGLRLLILDPIVSAVAGDSHKNAEVRRALQPVVALAHRIGCAVLGITHFTKGTSGRDPIERITGSLAFAALARVVLVAAKVKAELGEDAEPRRVLMRAKSNIGPDGGGFVYSLERVEVAPEVEGQRVRWGEALNGSARDMLTEAEGDPADAAANTDINGFLRGLLADGPLPVKAIKADADGAGYSWDQVKRASLRIGIEKQKSGMSGGWLWALPAEGSEGSARPNAAPFEGGAEGCTHRMPLPSHSSLSSAPFEGGEGVEGSGVYVSAPSVPPSDEEAF